MKKVGLTLSGGGVRGVAHLGVIKALHDLNIEPEIITGTSIGSLIGGLYASGMDIDDIIQLIQDNVKRAIIEPNYSLILKSIFKFQIPNGFLKGNRIIKLIDKHTNEINIKDINKKIAFVSTNLNGGRNVIFTNGDINLTGNHYIIDDIKLSTAIRSSISLPVIFSPVILDDMVLVDGGLVNNYPVDLAQNLGADIIISSDINYSGAILEKNSATQVMSRTLDILISEARMDNKKKVTVPRYKINLEKLRDIGTLDFSSKNLDRAINFGYEKTIEIMEKTYIK